LKASVRHFGFDWSKRRDPDGTKLGEVLAAHARYDRARTSREVRVRILAGSGVGVWIAAQWPALLPTPLREAVLAAWALVLGAAVAAGIDEVSARRRLERRIAEIDAAGSESPGSTAPPIQSPISRR
jgi:hypothetical protein